MSIEISREIRDKIEDVMGDFRVVERKEGYSNKVFVLEAKGEIYVLKIAKELKSLPEPYGLFNEYVALKFLESKGIDFVPRAAYYSGDPEFSI